MQKPEVNEIPNSFLDLLIDILRWYKCNYTRPDEKDLEGQIERDYISRLIRGAIRAAAEKSSLYLTSTEAYYAKAAIKEAKYSGDSSFNEDIVFQKLATMFLPK